MRRKANRRAGVLTVDFGFGLTRWERPMTITEQDMREFRERVKQIAMKAGMSEGQAEITLQRVGARLAGHTHAEAMAMYPDADADSDSNCATCTGPIKFFMEDGGIWAHCGPNAFFLNGEHKAQPVEGSAAFANVTTALCDDDGLVVGEYLERMNSLRMASGLMPYVGSAFLCTGSMHALGSVLIRCTSPAHTREA